MARLRPVSVLIGRWVLFTELVIDLGHGLSRRECISVSVSLHLDSISLFSSLFLHCGSDLAMPVSICFPVCCKLEGRRYCEILCLTGIQRASKRAAEILEHRCRHESFTVLCLLDKEELECTEPRLYETAHFCVKRPTFLWQTQALYESCAYPLIVANRLVSYLQCSNRERGPLALARTQKPFAPRLCGRST